MARVPSAPTAGARPKAALAASAWAVRACCCSLNRSAGRREAPHCTVSRTRTARAFSGAVRTAKPGSAVMSAVRS